MHDFLLPPSHHELLRVSGADAVRFLQGQLTCDVAALAEGSFVYGAACNTKGRVIAPFVLLRAGDDFLLLFRRGLAERFSGALRKFLPFYKCSMQAETGFCCVGLTGSTSAAWLEQQAWPAPPEGTAHAAPAGWVLRLAGTTPQYLLLAPAEGLVPVTDAAALQPDDGRQWQAALLRNGHYPFDTEDSEQFTPQELQYEERSYISFTKGCYTGQEIVARMHYRGKPKKRLYRIEFDCDPAQPPESLSLLDTTNSVVAQCSKQVCLPTGRGLALAQLPIELAEQHPTLPTSTGSAAAVTRF